MTSSDERRGRCQRPLVVRCGAFGDMVLLTALIRDLAKRHGCDVDVLASGPWSRPLLDGQPGVGEIFCIRSRKTPFWLSVQQQRVVRRLRSRGPGPTWYCDGNDAARPLLARAGIPDDFIVDVKDHPLLPGEHATQQWRRLAQIPPAHGAPRARSAGETGAAGGVRSAGGAGGEGIVRVAGGAGTADGVREAGDELPDVASEPGGCYLEVSDRQRADLDRWLRTRRLSACPIIALQVGNKRTMRRGLRRLAPNSKYWPPQRWATVLRHLRARHPSHAIVLLGTGPEFRLNAEIAALAGIDQLFNVADDLPVPRLLALLARAQGLITVDSGPAHAGAAVGCPQVVLFGKASTSLYRPWGTAGADVKVLTGHIDGVADMLGIDATDVIAAWDALRLRS